MMILSEKWQGRNRGRYRILKHKHIPELASNVTILGLSHKCTAQVVTNNAHAICKDRRMASHAMQWHIIDAACRQTRMRHDAVLWRWSWGLQKSLKADTPASRTPIMDGGGSTSARMPPMLE
jgi:hypothetical protein